MIAADLLKTMGYTANIATRFAAKTEQTESGCILWTAATAKQKNKSKTECYGVIRKNGSGPLSRTAKAHRAAWELAYGPIPDGMMICHRCDVPSCVNIDHLFLGTNADNCADRNAKGRQARGERHENHKLTEDQVRTMRRSTTVDLRSYKKFAEEYSVSTTTISNVFRGKSWTHVV